MKQVMIQNTLKNIQKAAPKARCKRGEPYSTLNYAKVYYRGGGWWIISGYHWNGKDTDESLALVIGEKA